MFEMSIIKQSNSDLSVFKDTNGTKIAVAIENLCFTYVKKFKANPALNGTKLRVPLGKIYALLGPNGCGKTTLLKTVTGMLKPEFGYVSVFGYRPRTISSGVPGSGLGYMPQEFALQTNLTLSEIMLYFGRIYSLDNDFLLEQIEWLVDTLELPPKDTFIEDMGEGQKRRSSLALAIMHKPRLLVLDEPTVGVDPMLCQMIWDLIRKISERDSTTILMTTHYLEEAKKAHCVGFMRKGQMLAEGPPMTLLAQYRAKSLEEIFFKLCLTQKRKKSDILNAEITRRSSIMTVDNIGLSYVVREPMNQFRGTLSLYLTIVWVMVRKHMIEVLREPGTFVSLFLFQLFATVLLYACIGSNEVSTRAGWIEVKPSGNNASAIRLSKTLREEILSQSVQLTDYKDLRIALTDLESRRIFSIIYLNLSLLNTFEKAEPLVLSATYWNDSVASVAGIRIYSNLNRTDISSRIFSAVQRAILNSKYRISGNHTDLLDSNHEMLSCFEEPTRFNSNLGDSIVPGFLLFLSYILCFAISGISLILEQNNVMLVRTFAAGVTPSQFVTAHVVSCFMPLSFITSLQLMFAIHVLEITFKGPTVLAFGLTLLLNLDGIVHGILTATLIRNRSICCAIIFGLFGYLLLCSGAFWPSTRLPYFIEWVNTLLPFRYFTESFLNLLSNQNSASWLLLDTFIMGMTWFTLPLMVVFFVHTIKYWHF